LEHPRQRCLSFSDERTRRALGAVRDKRVLLYQGHFGAGPAARRRNVEPIARALRELDGSYHLVLMGPRVAAVDYLQDRYSNVSYVPYIPPPSHLEVTSHAHIGIATYGYDDLNNVFCAPNKIWEYMGFGVPVLCQDIPGLRFTVAAADAGVCVDFEHTPQITGAINQIERDYSRYSRRAAECFDAVEPARIIGGVINGNA
jgi:glycosyltransferase involved in cell wall biosynthesis